MSGAESGADRSVEPVNHRCHDSKALTARCDWRRVERQLLPPLVNALKHICLALIQRVKQACLLPPAIANAVQQRRQRTVLNEREAERLDRIRNPSKYLGK